MRCFLVGLALSLAGVGNGTPGQQRPEALERLEAYRAALQTGHVEWSIVDHMLDVYGGETRFRTSRFAGTDHILIERGDENGVVMRTEDGAPAPVIGMRPVYMLETGAQFWHRPEDPLQGATVYPQAAQQRNDIRSLGAAACLPRLDIHDVLWRDFARNPSAREFEEERHGGLHVVRVRKSDGTTTYWLDPERGWSPVRVRNEHDVHGWSESRSTLKEFDGVWFPQVVEIFSDRYKDGRQPEKIIRVYSATFNRPEHPRRLTPADIGMEVGMEVCVRGVDMKPEMLGKWDGEKVVSHDEFIKRSRSGELTEGPEFIRAAVQASAKAAQDRLAAARAEGGVAAVWTGPMTVEQARKALLLTPKQFESLWEGYTIAFIRKYAFNEEQTQKALLILKSCQQQGDAHVGKHKSDLDRLDQRVKALMKLKGEELTKAQAEVRRERERLLKPLNDIFEQELKPRLEKLPTRAQRKAVERSQRAAQQSAKPDATKDNTP